MGMDQLQKKKVEQIANFIVNNITLAEISAMVIEKATETAEFIVQNELDPKDFDSPVARKKLNKKISIEKGKIKLEEEESWYNNILNKIGLGKKPQEQEEKKLVTLRTRKKDERK